MFAGQTVPRSSAIRNHDDSFRTPLTDRVRPRRPCFVPCLQHDARTMFAVFRHRKMTAIALLGFASGFPYLITNRVLQTWLTMNGINLTTIGFLSLAGLPYSLKFLWAPFLDRYAFPGLGRRKGWLLASQILLAIAIASMTFQDPKVTLQWVAANAVVIAFLSATQDITADAYRVDTLQPDEATAGAGVFVSFYRVALIVTGAFAFLLADRTSWQT